MPVVKAGEETINPVITKDGETVESVDVNKAGVYRLTYNKGGYEELIITVTVEEKPVENQEQDTPTGLIGVAPTTADSNDGKITNVTTEMEYKLKGSTNWKDITGTEITGLAVGTYEVRFAAKEGYNASPVTEVIVPQYVDTTVADITDFDELKNALENENVKTINVKTDISLTEALEINRAVIINGNKKTITVSTDAQSGIKQHGLIVSGNGVKVNNLIITGATGYNIQVYNAKDVTLDSVTLSNADKGGLLVNASTVTVNNIETKNNAWGGIEVSKGEGATKDAKLTVTGVSKHDEEVHIWTVGDKASVEAGNQYKSGADIREGKEGYVNYILASEDRPIPYTEEETKKALGEAVKTALNYKYDSEYAYVGTPKFSNNTVSITYDSIEAAGEDYVEVMNDMARYLGALYWQDNGSTVKSVTYNSIQYEWDKSSSGNLKGSNWYKERTLVSVIVDDFRNATPEDPVTKITVTVSDGTNNVDVTLTFKIEGN